MESNRPRPELLSPGCLLYALDTSVYGAGVDLFKISDSSGHSPGMIATIQDSTPILFISLLPKGQMNERWGKSKEILEVFWNSEKWMIHLDDVSESPRNTM